MALVVESAPNRTNPDLKNIFLSQSPVKSVKKKVSKSPRTFVNPSHSYTHAHKVKHLETASPVDGLVDGSWTGWWTG